MVNVLDTAVHDKLKAQTPGYAGREVPGLENDIDSVLAMVVDKLRTKYAVIGREDRGKKPLLEFASLATYFTLDSTAKISFGKDLGHIKEEKDVYGYIEGMEKLSPVLAVIMVVPYLRWIFSSKLVVWWLSPKPWDKKGIGAIRRYVLLSLVSHF